MGRCAQRSIWSSSVSALTSGVYRSFELAPLSTEQARLLSDAVGAMMGIRQISIKGREVHISYAPLEATADPGGGWRPSRRRLEGMLAAGTGVLHRGMGNGKPGSLARSPFAPPLSGTASPPRPWIARKRVAALPCDAGSGSRITVGRNRKMGRGRATAGTRPRTRSYSPLYSSSERAELMASG